MLIKTIRDHRGLWVGSTVSTILLAIWYGAAKYCDPDYRGGSTAGLGLGVIALLLMVFCSFLTLYKIVPRGNTSRGPQWRIAFATILRAVPVIGKWNSQTWLRNHLCAGCVSLPAVLFHCDFHWAGWQEWFLIWCYFIVFGSGVFGLILQQCIPATMTRDMPMETFIGQDMNVRRSLLKRVCQQISDACSRIADAAFDHDDKQTVESAASVEASNSPKATAGQGRADTTAHPKNEKGVEEKQSERAVTSKSPSTERDNQNTSVRKYLDDVTEAAFTKAGSEKRTYYNCRNVIPGLPPVVRGNTTLITYVPDTPAAVTNRYDAMSGSQLPSEYQEDVHTLMQFYETTLLPYVVYDWHVGVLEPIVSHRSLTGPLRAELSANWEFSGIMHEVLDVVDKVTDERRQLETLKQYWFWLHGWLVIHVPLCWALFALTAFHVVTSTYLLPSMGRHL